jgi:hypothetical protein
MHQRLINSEGNAVHERISGMLVVDHVAVWLIQHLVRGQREDEAFSMQEVRLVLLRRLVAHARQIVLVAIVEVVEAERLPERRGEVLLQAGRAELGDQRLVAVVLVHVGLARGVHVADVDAATLVANGVGQGHVGCAEGDGALRGAERKSALVSATWAVVSACVGGCSANEGRQDENSLVLGNHVKMVVLGACVLGAGKESGTQKRLLVLVRWRPRVCLFDELHELIRVQSRLL